MRMKVGFTLSALPLSALCFTVNTQQAKKIARIGYLSSNTPARESARFEAIRLGLRELGYIEGQNINDRVPICEGEAVRNPEAIGVSL